MRVEEDHLLLNRFDLQAELVRTIRAYRRGVLEDLAGEPLAAAVAGEPVATHVREWRRRWLLTPEWWQEEGKLILRDWKDVPQWRRTREYHGGGGTRLPEFRFADRPWNRVLEEKWATYKKEVEAAFRAALTEFRINSEDREKVKHEHLRWFVLRTVPEQPGELPPSILDIVINNNAGADESTVAKAVKRISDHARWPVPPLPKTG